MEMSGAHTDVLLSEDYWKSRCASWTGANSKSVGCQSLLEESCFCLLGGFGITFENNEFYFWRLHEYGLLAPSRAVESAIYEVLQTRFEHNDKRFFYRFPAQRARRLSRFIKEFSPPPGVSDLEMRQYLTEFEGIGPKTASWIVRNSLGSSRVAIIDVHVVRACVHLGIFPRNPKVDSSYQQLERAFLDFSQRISVDPALLDLVMWHDMRKFGSKLLANNNAT